MLGETAIGSGNGRKRRIGHLRHWQELQRLSRPGNRIIGDAVHRANSVYVELTVRTVSIGQHDHEPVSALAITASLSDRRLVIQVRPLDQKKRSFRRVEYMDCEGFFLSLLTRPTR